MIKISIITATYNSATTLRQTIESVLNQDYPNIEYIVIDGGSTDGTVKILQDYSSRIAYWVSEPDSGIYDAFNKGIRAATGDYIQFLGSDDCFCGTSVISQMAAAIDRQTDILSAAIYWIDSRRNLQLKVGNEKARNKEQFDGEMIPHPGMFTRAGLMKEHMFDTSFRIAADYDFFLDCYLNRNVYFRFVDFPAVFFSLDGISGTNSPILQTENQRIWEKYHLIKTMEDNQAAASRHNKGWRVLIRNAIKAVGLYPWFLIHFRGWEPHRCENKICRWCGREG